MKQKIVIKVSMTSDKGRTKALKIAAVEKGVNSVSIEGKDKDQVAVIGEEIDSVCLTNALRKKLGHANIVTVEEVKDKKDKKDEKDEKDKKEEEIKALAHYYWNRYPPYPLVYEDAYNNSCIVM